MRGAGAVFLVYLAWRIAFSRSLGSDEAVSSPISFGQAWAFQWANPKAWFMGVTAMTVYTNSEQPVASVFIVTLGFIGLCFIAISAWTGFGQILRGWLADPVRLKWFNIGMGVALVLTLIPMLA